MHITHPINLEGKAMRFTTAMGFFIGFTAFACAPVASSVPKLATVSPRTADSIATGEKVDLRVPPVEVRVVLADKMNEERKKLRAAGYEADTNVFDDRDAKFSELKELRALTEIGLPAGLNRAEIVIVFGVKQNEKSIRSQIAEDLKVKPMRGDLNVFTFAVSMDGDSAAAWSYVKQNLDSVVIASREAKKKN